MVRLALAIAALAIVGAVLFDSPTREPPGTEQASSVSTPTRSARSLASTSPSDPLPEPAPHLAALLELPHDELAQLISDPTAARELVRADLKEQAEDRARTELSVAGVVIDDPAALERALAAARAARQTPAPR